MKNNFSLIIAISGFILAIFLCSFFKFGLTFSFFLIFLCLILFLFKKFFLLDKKNEQKIFLLIFFLLFFSLGIFRYEIKNSKSLDINLENNIGEKVSVSGIISDEIKIKEKQAILIVDFKNLIIASSSITIFGKGIISTNLYPEFKYGDLINISGKLEKPENFSNFLQSNSQSKSRPDISEQNPNNFELDDFDYVSYLAKDNIFYKIDFAKTEFISSGNGNIIKSFLFEIKNSFIDNINKTISEPESSLLSGILLGAKNSIDKNTTENFRKAGLSHIVALSGYNITIVANAIMKIFSFFPYNIKFTFGIFGIILFVIMTGASSTAVRAGVMALIIILASITYRNYQAGRALFIAGFLMVIINPKILVFDISFQLSFLATIAIIYISPILKNKFNFITEKFGLREIVSTTISVQILVLPLILYKMNLLSFVALPTNILIIGLLPAIMFFGFITGMLGFFYLPLSLLFSWISWLLLAYIIKVAEFFANLPFSSINISWFSFSMMIFYYIVIVIYLFIKNNQKK
ncbi:MAG: ComEC/Rec2 family competence protein [bacterium]